MNRLEPALKAISMALALGMKEASVKNTAIETAAEVSSRGRRTVLATVVERFWKKVCMAVSIYCTNEKAHCTGGLLTGLGARLGYLRVTMP